MIDYINPEIFESISDYSIFHLDQKFWNDSILNQNAIIYCHPDNILDLFNNIKSSNFKYILITSGSDYTITSDIFKSRPTNIIRWYGVNVGFNHPDLIPIPYGLSPNKGAAKTIHNIDTLTNKKSIDYYSNKDKNIETLYCNWAWQNNPSIRGKIIPSIKRANIKYKWERELKLAADGTFREDIPFTEYCEHLSSYKFIISPPGNGTDCHRTWESLYMGSIPIVINNYIYETFSDLPIIQIDNYSNLTYELMHSYLNKKYNTEKLYMSYWKEKILNDFNTL